MFEAEKFTQQLDEALATFPPELLEKLTPALPEEIEELEAQLKPYKLPKAFKVFLAHIGRNTGEVFDLLGPAWDYVNRVRILRNSAEENLNLYGGTFPLQMMVLHSHLGSELHYIDLTEGEDPPVYYWEEGGGGLEDAEIKNEALSTFILWALAERSKLWAQLSQ